MYVDRGAGLLHVASGSDMLCVTRDADLLREVYAIRDG